MGYYTSFEGGFNVTPPLKDVDEKYLSRFFYTRRVARNIEGYGIEGEFYVGGSDDTVIDYNRPPKTQPNLWCGWELSDDERDFITAGQQGESKFTGAYGQAYDFEAWLVYLIDKILIPRGYTLNGDCYWCSSSNCYTQSGSLCCDGSGEETGDAGVMRVADNKLHVSLMQYVQTDNLQGVKKRIVAKAQGIIDRFYDPEFLNTDDPYQGIEDLAKGIITIVEKEI